MWFGSFLLLMHVCASPMCTSQGGGVSTNCHAPVSDEQQFRADSLIGIQQATDLLLCQAVIFPKTVSLRLDVSQGACGMQLLGSLSPLGSSRAPHTRKDHLWRPDQLSSWSFASRFRIEDHWRSVASCRKSMVSRILAQGTKSFAGQA